MRRAAIPSGIATIVVAGAALVVAVGALVGPRGGPLGLANLLAAHLAIAIRIRRPSAPRRPFACPSRTTRATATQPWRSSTRIDAVFTRGLDPLTIATDCSRPGDHCLVRADLAVP